MKICLNGQIVDGKDAVITVFDRGYLFGEGLFETLRSYDGKLPFFEKHLNRLEWSATFIGIPSPHPQSVKKAIHDTLSANKLKNARIKVVLSAVNRHTFRPAIPVKSMEVNMVVACEPFAPYSAADYRKGASLGFVHSIKNDSAPASNIKSLSWMTKMIARKEFMEKDFFDGILLDSRGYVTETTSANIFWVTDVGGVARLETSPLSLGLLPGVTREVVIEIAKGNGIDFMEEIVDSESLVKASEVMITASTLEIMPIKEIDSHRIGNGKPGKITRLVRELYRKRLTEEIGFGA